MSVAINAVYLIALCLCGWRVIYRVVTRKRGESRPYDALLWLSAAVLVLIPVVADVTAASCVERPRHLLWPRISEAVTRGKVTLWTDTQGVD